MIAQLGQSNLYLIELLTLAIFIVHWKKQSKTNDQYDLLLILNTFAAVITWTTFFLLMDAFVRRDYTLTLVYLNVNNRMPYIDRIMATWAARQGVMILWAAILTSIVSLAMFYLREHRFDPVVKRAITIMLFFSALIAMSAANARDPMPFETQALQSNGYGLAPSLMSRWMEIHPPIAFLCYSVFVVPYAIGIAMLSTSDFKTPAMRKLSWLNDIFILMGWVLTSLFIIAGSIWGYEENWAGFWAWDPVETASLVMWFSATLYFHARAHAPEGHPLRVFVGSIGWVAVTFAAFVVRSGLLEGFHAYVGIEGAIIFGSLFLGTLLGLVYALLRNGEQVFPENVFVRSQSKSSLPSFLSFWILMSLIVVNVIGLVMQMINGVITHTTKIPYAYYIPLNGLGLLALMVLMPMSDLKQNGWNRNMVITVFSLFFIFGAILIYSVIPFSIVQIIISAFIIGTFGLLVVNLGSSLLHGKKLKLISIQIVHLAVLIMLFAYFTVNSSTTINEYMITPKQMYEEPEFNIAFTAVWVMNQDIHPIIRVTVYNLDDMSLMGTVDITQGTRAGEYWTRGDWIIEPTRDLFFRSTRTEFHPIISDNDIIPLAIHEVPFANAFRVAFFTMIAVGIFSLAATIRRRPRIYHNITTKEQPNLPTAS